MGKWHPSLANEIDGNMLFKELLCPAVAIILVAPHRKGLGT